MKNINTINLISETYLLKFNQYLYLINHQQ